MSQHADQEQSLDVFRGETRKVLPPLHRHEGLLGGDLRLSPLAHHFPAEALPTLAVVMIEAGSPGDREQPCDTRGLRPKSAEPPEGANEGLLNHVVEVGSVRGELPRAETPNILLRPHDHAGEGPVVTVLSHHQVARDVIHDMKG